VIEIKLKEGNIVISHSVEANFRSIGQINSAEFFDIKRLNYWGAFLMQNFLIMRFKLL